ncbi:hypothetical protein Bca52824_001079 [Brassica carinata]|uniref:Uncharacterized protein n=1 Tax=Brassica carinata TaxID=52824 RepID=A0A8X7WHM6_BRACI|nr:hypothetical protein Bca52824_001079 [Brassica carinata]
MRKPKTKKKAKILDEETPIQNETGDGHLPQHPSITSIDIRRTEFADDLVFTPIIPIERQEQPGWGVWSDDDKEDIVIYLEQLIADHTPSTNKCDMLTEIVIQLTKQVKQLRREMKRRKKRVHGRQSSFHTLLLRRKKSNTPTHQSEPTPNNTESLHNQDDGAMATNELPERLSPIISQYEAQLHRDSTVSPLASSPVSEPCIHTQSVHVSPDHNTRMSTHLPFTANLVATRPLLI